MTDPATGAIVKAGVKTTGALGKRLFEAANGARSSVKSERAIAELLAEEAGERQGELEAAAIAKGRPRAS